MKNLLLVTLIFISTITTKSYADQNSDKQGKFFINAGALTNSYKFKLDPLRTILPTTITQQFGTFDFTGKDTDIINYNFALGYYVSDRLALRLNYSDDIELGFFEGFLSSESFDFEMDMIEFDATWNAIELGSNANIFVLAGVFNHTIDATAFDTQDGVRTVVDSASVSSIDFKYGVGLQWDVVNNWGLKAGYTKYDFLSMDKLYLNIEFRF